MCPKRTDTAQNPGDPLSVSLKEIKEGKVSILGPKLELYSDKNRIEPCWAPIFYNPAMEVDRNISVAFLQSFSKAGSKKLRICDALSATGIRGLRYAKEVENVEYVILNDINKLAYNLIKINIEKNDLKDIALPFHSDANVLLAYFAHRGRRFNVVDIDPFGSPVPFLDNAIRAVENNGLLCVTATDLAPLMGIFQRACIRKYSAIPIRCVFSREIGLRILIGYVVKTGAKYGLRVVPLLSYSRGHYMRLFLKIRTGKKRADESLDKLGYITFCPRCGEVQIGKYSFLLEKKCKNCDSKVKIGGPLWLGELCDSIFLKKTVEVFEEFFGRKKEGFKILEKLLNEHGMPPYFYTTDYIAKTYRFEKEPTLNSIIYSLREMGYKTTHTHFSTKGFKTYANVNTIVEAFRRASEE
ncbi:MAG: tRNA (guanine(10)-N(2))-dimethyltransferase [Thermoprotei archaeon]|nr:MAG: tRNA (guanine(10)-N(2))-dimethyltransferase [Thermoprotei archaeon]